MNTLNIIIILNSIALIFFILNQNDSSKDSITTSNSSVSKNHFESVTWTSFLFQLSFLIIQIKSIE